jgi:hypothetical protein
MADVYVRLKDVDLSSVIVYANSTSAVFVFI